MDSSYIDKDNFKNLEKIFLGKKNVINFNLTNFIKQSDKNRRADYEKISFLKDAVKLSSLEMDDLIQKNVLALLSKKEERLTFTFKGILIFNYNLVRISIQLNIFLDDLNKIYFNKVMKLSKDPLASQEKAIVLGLLGTMSISEDYALKPKKENEIFIKNSVDIGAKFIESLGKDFDDGELCRLWKLDVIGEGPILGQFRRTNTLPLHTEGIYQKKNKGHYLDILKNGSVDKTKLKFLLKRIFDRRSLTYPERKDLIKSLNEIKNYEFKIHKENPPFNTLLIRKQIKTIIERDI